MYYKHIITLLLLLHSFLFSKAFPRDVIFYGLDQDITLLKVAVVSVEKITLEPQVIPLGSGCIVSANGNIGVITCYHVISNIKKNERLIVGVNTNLGKVYCSSSVIKADSIQDLAFISIDDLIAGVQLDKIAKMPAKDLSIKQNPLDSSMFAQDSQIREGLSTLIIGFPLGLGSAIISNYPISRIGIVAQVIPNNPRFLIDGMTSHGNSGSPVFSGTDIKFIGLIRGGPADMITAFDENKNLVISLPYNSGLSECISAPTIYRFLFTQ